MLTTKTISGYAKLKSRIFVLEFQRMYGVIHSSSIKNSQFIGGLLGNEPIQFNGKVVQISLPLLPTVENCYFNPQVEVLNGSVRDNLNIDALFK